MLSCLGKDGGRHDLRQSDHSRHSGCFSRAWLNSLGLAGPAWMFLKTPHFSVLWFCALRHPLAMGSPGFLSLAF